VNLPYFLTRFISQRHKCIKMGNLPKMQKWPHHFCIFGSALSFGDGAAPHLRLSLFFRGFYDIGRRRRCGSTRTTELLRLRTLAGVRVLASGGGWRRVLSEARGAAAGRGRAGVRCAGARLRGVALSWLVGARVTTTLKSLADSRVLCYIMACGVTFPKMRSNETKDSPPCLIRSF